MNIWGFKAIQLFSHVQWNGLPFVLVSVHTWNQQVPKTKPSPPTRQRLTGLS